MKDKTSATPKRILFTHYGDNWIRGSERCLLDLIKYINKSEFTPVLWCNQPLMAKEARQLGIEVHCNAFPILFGWNKPKFDFLGFLKLIKQAKKLIKQYQIDLIHANSAAPCQWLTFAARQCNVPLICHLHSIYQLRDRLTLGLYQTDMVVGVSDYVVSPLIKDKKPRQQISVIANGIDTNLLLNQPITNLRQALNIKPGDFVISSLGSLIHRKGIDLLISATKILNEKNIPTHLLVIGQGPALQDLQTHAKTLDIENKISFMGESKKAVGILRGTADLFVSGAREEAFGLVFSEASLAELAIVAPNTGGIPNAVLDQQTGILFPAQNTDALVQAIQDLYLDPIRCNEMAKAGKQHVMQNFTIEQNTRRFQALYHQQINQFKAKQPWYFKGSHTIGWISSVLTALSNRYQRTHNQG